MSSFFDWFEFKRFLDFSVSRGCSMFCFFGGLLCCFCVVNYVRVLPLFSEFRRLIFLGLPFTDFWEKLYSEKTKTKTDNIIKQATITLLIKSLCTK